MAGPVALVALFLLAYSFHICIGSSAKIFTFPEYPYKESSKNDLLFQKFEQACKESGACKTTLSQKRSTMANTRCIRECVSPSCYNEIYFPDQLEEGEIDVRLNSFKGCFLLRNSRLLSQNVHP